MKLDLGIRVRGGEGDDVFVDRRKRKDICVRSLERTKLGHL